MKTSRVKAFLVIFSLMAAFVMQACAKPAATPSSTVSSTTGITTSNVTSTTPTQKEVVLSAVELWAAETPQVYAFTQWVNRLNELGKGKVRIDIKGGPEVIGKMDQFTAMRNGAVDVTLSAGGAHMGDVPEGQFLSITPWPTPQFPDIVKREQESGLTALMTEVYQKKAGVQYLGRMLLFSPNYLFTIDPIATPSDLKGRRITSLSRYNPVLEKYGAVPVVIADAENYSSLQKGIVGGYVGPLTSVLTLHWNDFLKYCVPLPFFEQDVSVQMNLQKWNSLPDDVKKLINDTIAYAQQEYVTKYYQGTVSSAVTQLKASGMKFIDFSSADAKVYEDAINAGVWAMLEAKADPAYLARFKAIVAKAGQ